MGAKDAAVKKRITWLIPPVFLIAGVVFYVCVSGCSFLGIVFCGIASICIVDNLLSIWKDRKAFRIAKNAWNILVIGITVAAIVTVIPILRGPTEVKSRSDFCIVLGAGVKGTEPSEILQDRIDQAYAYLTKNPDVICIATGGKGNDENISEAQCIYDHLTAMGIDGNRIWMERVKGNCATQAFGRTNAIEITKEDFRFVPAVYKTMLTRLKQGEYIIQNPVFRSMLNVNFPLPIYKYYD